MWLLLPLGSQSKAIDAFMGTMMAVSVGTWLLCRSTQKEEAELIKSAAVKMAQKQVAKQEAGAAAAAKPPPPTGK